MVRFILGRAGTGKTWHCLAQIEELVRADPLGTPIFLLVPRQATFQAERELVRRLEGFSRVQVASLDDLGRLILEDCGDVGIPQVTAIGRRLVIGHLLRKHEQSLHFYGSCARRAGLAAELDATFGEMERFGVDVDTLEQANTFAPDDPLAGKLRDLTLLLRQYNDYIGQGRLDPRRRMERILQRVSECGLLRQAHVFVDEFYDFGGQELKLLLAVAKASARTEIALLMDPDSPLLREPDLLPEDLSLFHRTERTYRALHRSLVQANVAMEPPLLLQQPRRFESATLLGIERGWRNAAPAPLANKGFERFTAPDIRAEIDAVARRIRQAISTGIRLRDIAVLVREPEQYHGLIDASFAEHALPYFIDRRRAAVHHPLLQFVRAALLIARHNWPHEMVMALIKSGLANIPDSDADLLENYVLQHRIRGRTWESPQPWAYRRRLTRHRDQDDATPPPADDSTHFDQMRRSLVEKLSPLLNILRKATAAAPAPVSELLRQLLATLDAFGVRLILERWMQEAASAGQHEQRAEHEQVWANFIVLLEQMHELLGPESASADDFLAMLDSGLEGFDLAVSPPTLDGILVGQPDRTRTPEVKWTFVLGLNEGSFPRLSRPDCVLNDGERRRLGRHNVELEPDTQRRLLDERLLAYIAVTRASQHLVVSRPLADEKDRATNPSAFWLELERLCPDAPLRQEPRAASDSSADPASIGTPRQLVTTLMHWARSPESDDDAEQPWPALYQWLAHGQDCGDALAAMRGRAWRALSYTNTATLSPESAARLFPAPLPATAGQLETFAACPFRHFARYGLQLESRESANVTSLDLSNAYHHVLENLVTTVLRQRQDWCDLPEESLAAMIHAHAAEIGRQLRGELMLSSSRNRYLLHRIETTLEEAVAGQCAMHRRGRYRPAFAGVRFGDDQPLPALEIPTPAGRQVRLRGRIDRVDLHPDDATFTVSDYRMRGNALQLDQVHYGLNLQLLTYLLVLSASGQALAGRPISPAAAFLLGVLRPRRSVDHPDDALDPADPDFHLQAKPRGIIHRNSIASFDSELQTGDSPVISVFLKKDGSPGNRHRTDLAEAEEFAALLRWVEKHIGQIADQITSGDIRVRPYMLGNATPCPTCEFRGVCRFEPTINGYRFLHHLKREEVLARCCTNGGGGDETG